MERNPKWLYLAYNILDNDQTQSAKTNAKNRGVMKHIIVKLLNQTVLSEPQHNAFLENIRNRVAKGDDFVWHGAIRLTDKQVRSSITSGFAERLCNLAGLDFTKVFLPKVGRRNGRFEVTSKSHSSHIEVTLKSPSSQVEVRSKSHSSQVQVTFKSGSSQKNDDSANDSNESGGCNITQHNITKHNLTKHNTEPKGSGHSPSDDVEFASLTPQQSSVCSQGSPQMIESSSERQWLKKERSASRGVSELLGASSERHVVSSSNTAGLLASDWAPEYDVEYGLGTTLDDLETRATYSTPEEPYEPRYDLITSPVKPGSIKASVWVGDQDVGAEVSWGSYSKIRFRFTDWDQFENKAYLSHYEGIDRLWVKWLYEQEGKRINREQRAYAIGTEPPAYKFTASPAYESQFNDTILIKRLAAFLLWNGDSLTGIAFYNGMEIEVVSLDAVESTGKQPTHKGKK